jgi:hypothetical protein
MKFILMGLLLAGGVAACKDAQKPTLYDLIYEKEDGSAWVEVYDVQGSCMRDAAEMRAMGVKAHCQLSLVQER